MTQNAKTIKNAEGKKKKERKRERRRRRRRNGDVLADLAVPDPGRRVTQVTACNSGSSARPAFSHCNPCFWVFFFFPFLSSLMNTYSSLMNTFQELLLLLSLWFFLLLFLLLSFSLLCF